jgi:hypothetical protein
MLSVFARGPTELSAASEIHAPLPRQGMPAHESFPYLGFDNNRAGAGSEVNAMVPRRPQAAHASQVKYVFGGKNSFTFGAPVTHPKRSA